MNIDLHADVPAFPRHVAAQKLVTPRIQDGRLGRYRRGRVTPTTTWVWCAEVSA